MDLDKRRQAREDSVRLRRLVGDRAMFRSDVLSAARRWYSGVAVLLACTLVACSEPSQKPDTVDRLLALEIVIHPLGHPESTQQQVHPIRLWMGPVVGSINGMLSDSAI